MHCVHSTDVRQITGWLKRAQIDAPSHITSSLLWQCVNESWCSSGPTVLWSFVPAWLMACHSSPRLSMRMGDYNRVSRQERLAYPVASFLPHIDNNVTTQLYNQQSIDRSAVWPLAHLLATDRESPSLVSCKKKNKITRTQHICFHWKKLSSYCVNVAKGHKALMTRGWRNVKCLKAWINLKVLQGVFVFPLFFPHLLSSSLCFCIFYSTGE